MIVSRPKPEQISKAPLLVPIFVPASLKRARRAHLCEDYPHFFFVVHEYAERGSAEAQALVAFLYLCDWVKNVDSRHCARLWAERSAQSGDPYGQWVLAWILLEDMDVDTGINYLMLSAEQDFMPAIFHLGQFLVSGTRFRKSLDDGLRVISVAARMGHSLSKRYICDMNVSGQRGLAKKIFGYAVLRPSVVFSLISHAIPRVRYGQKALYYWRYTHVANAIRRERQGEEIGKEYERSIDEVFARFSAW